MTGPSSATVLRSLNGGLPADATAEEVRRAAEMLLGHMQEEIVSLCEELTRARHLAAPLPVHVHLDERRARCADRPCKWKVVVDYRPRVFEFTSWPEASAFIRQVRTDITMAAIDAAASQTNGNGALHTHG